MAFVNSLPIQTGWEGGLAEPRSALRSPNRWASEVPMVMVDWGGYCGGWERKRPRKAGQMRAPNDLKVMREICDDDDDDDDDG